MNNLEFRSDDNLEFKPVTGNFVELDSLEHLKTPNFLRSRTCIFFVNDNLFRKLRFSFRILRIVQLNDRDIYSLQGRFQ